MDLMHTTTSLLLRLGRIHPIEFRTKQRKDALDRVYVGVIRGITSCLENEDVKGWVAVFSIYRGCGCGVTLSMWPASRSSAVFSVPDTLYHRITTTLC